MKRNGLAEPFDSKNFIVRENSFTRTIIPIKDCTKII
jgi:hypothetical protein